MLINTLSTIQNSSRWHSKCLIFFFQENKAWHLSSSRKMIDMKIQAKITEKKKKKK